MDVKIFVTRTLADPRCSCCGSPLPTNTEWCLWWALIIIIRDISHSNHRLIDCLSSSPQRAASADSGISSSPQLTRDCHLIYRVFTIFIPPAAYCIDNVSLLPKTAVRCRWKVKRLPGYQHSQLYWSQVSELDSSSAAEEETECAH